MVRNGARARAETDVSPSHFPPTRVRDDATQSELDSAVQEIYRDHRITVTPKTIPSRAIGRNGPTGRGWTVMVNGQDVTKEVLRLGMGDPEIIMSAAKKYVDEMLR